MGLVLISCVLNGCGRFERVQRNMVREYGEPSAEQLKIGGLTILSLGDAQPTERCFLIDELTFYWLDPDRTAVIGKWGSLKRNDPEVSEETKAGIANLRELRP
jgi:hypothetical protein